jgi:Uma2 family endonuclease
LGLVSPDRRDEVKHTKAGLQPRTPNGKREVSVVAPGTRATRADLARTEGRAELIDGRIVRFPPFCYRTGCVVSALAFSLYDYERRGGKGEVGTATLGYLVPRLPSGRESFCPCVSWYSGVLPANPMSFIEGPPTFAVETREADEEDVKKREDYFQAGTLVVWDVDVVKETIVRHQTGNPSSVTFRRGDVADAEPAVPDWRVNVDEVFG